MATSTRFGLRSLPSSLFTYVAKPSGSSHYRLDGHDPGAGEIISGKHTHLVERQERTAIGYVREVPRKYAPGTRISDVASTPDPLRGNTLAGRMVLEVGAETAVTAAEVAR